MEFLQSASVWTSLLSLTDSLCMSASCPARCDSKKLIQLPAGLLVLLNRMMTRIKQRLISNTAASQALSGNFCDFVQRFQLSPK